VRYIVRGTAPTASMRGDRLRMIWSPTNSTPVVEDDALDTDNLAAILAGMDGGTGGGPSGYTAVGGAHPVPGIYYGSDAQVGNALSTVALTAGTVYYQPIHLPLATTYNQIACEVTTADAGQTCRLGVYTSLQGQPDSLIFDSGDASIASTGKVEVTKDIVIPTAGWYWTSISSSSGTAEFLAYAPGWTRPTLGAPIAAATLGTTSTAFTGAGAYGAPPFTPAGDPASNAIATAVPVVVLGITAPAAAQSFVHVPRRFLRSG